MVKRYIYGSTLQCFTLFFYILYNFSVPRAIFNSIPRSIPHFIPGSIPLFRDSHSGFWASKSTGRKGVCHLPRQVQALSKMGGKYNAILFGHIMGHVVPGTIFLLLGFWWLCNVVYDVLISQLEHTDLDTDKARPYKSKTWYRLRRPLTGRCTLCKHLGEPFMKIAWSLMGAIMELTSARWTLFDDQGDFKDVNNFAHATMFGFFALTGVVDLLQFIGVLRSKHFSSLGHILMAMAFLVEGFLFYFHLDGRNKLDSHAHSIVYSICFATTLVLLLETIWMDSGILGLARCFLVLLQGTWFYQVAFMLFGPRKWSSKSKEAARFVPVAFAWHCLLLLIVLCIALAVGGKCIFGSWYYSSDGETISREHVLTNEESEQEILKEENDL